MEGHRATISIDGGTITFEGPQEFVEGQVARYMGSARSLAGPAADARADLRNHRLGTERDLVELKKPNGHHEFVAVLAFYFHETGVPEFTEADMRRAYLRAGIRPPKVVSQALRDAKNRCDYIEPGSKRGTYRLSAHGDRTVRFDLPRQDGR